jgi:hypothetical protein
MSIAQARVGNSLWRFEFTFMAKTDSYIVTIRARDHRASSSSRRATARSVTEPLGPDAA